MKIFTVTLNGKDYEVQQDDDGVFSLPDSLEHVVGVGTALKPAIEPIILARKPLDGTVANNVLAHGVGGLNIDACRVGTTGGGTHCGNRDSNGKCLGHGDAGKSQSGATFHADEATSPAGRFPANVLLDEHAAKEMDEQSGHIPPSRRVAKRDYIYENTGEFLNNFASYSKGRVLGHSDSGGASRFFPVFKSEEETPETKGRFPANVLLDEHAAKEMDKQSVGTRAEKPSKSGTAGATVQGATWKCWHKPGEEIAGYNDSGGASRFFPVFKYQAKAPKKERPVIEREDGTKIQHATVKPLALMEWLVSLIVPPGGVVLDPFAGSGTTLQAAINKGFQPIGIEQDADYIKLIEKRLEGTCTTHKN